MGFEKVGAFGQQTFDYVEVHFVAVPADCLVAVDVSVTVDEVVYIAVIPFAVRYDILKIKLSCFGEQRVKFFRYILFRKSTVFALFSFNNYRFV